MNEKELRAFLDENAETINERIRTKMIEQIAESYKWEVPDMVEETVREFLKEHVVPAVREHLSSQKGPILQAAITATAQITDALAVKMVEKAEENMKSYRFEEVIRSIFK